MKSLFLVKGESPPEQNGDQGTVQYYKPQGEDAETTSLYINNDGTFDLDLYLDTCIVQYMHNNRVEDNGDAVLVFRYNAVPISIVPDTITLSGLGNKITKLSIGPRLIRIRQANLPNYITWRELICENIITPAMEKFAEWLEL